MEIKPILGRNQAGERIETMGLTTTSTRNTKKIYREICMKKHPPQIVEFTFRPVLPKRIANLWKIIGGRRPKIPNICYNLLWGEFLYILVFRTRLMTISEGEAELLPAGIGHGTNALIPSMNDVQGMVWFELYELTLN